MTRSSKANEVFSTQKLDVSSYPEYLRFHSTTYFARLIYERTVRAVDLDAQRAVIYATLRKAASA